MVMLLNMVVIIVRPPIFISYMVSEYIMEDTGINTVFVPKFLRCDGHQLPDIVDNLADIVRNASGRVGCVWSLLEDNDVQFRFNPLCLGGGTHSCRISADDHKPFLLHFSCPSSLIVTALFSLFA